MNLDALISVSDRVNRVQQEVGLILTEVNSIIAREINPTTTAKPTRERELGLGAPIRCIRDDQANGNPRADFSATPASQPNGEVTARTGIKERCA